MTLPNPGAWQAKLESASPDFYKEVMDVRNMVLTDGALSLKVKVLMTMLCDAIMAHPDGVRNIANRARAVGATEEEIAGNGGRSLRHGGHRGPDHRLQRLQGRVGPQVGDLQFRKGSEPIPVSHRSLEGRKVAG